MLAIGWTWYSFWIVLGALVFTVTLLSTFIRHRGWPFYPDARFRLFAVRPFWYLQLMLPIVATAGFLGIFFGALFVFITDTSSMTPLDAGRASALAAFTGFGLFLFAGYLGSRRLRVRTVTVLLPSLPSSFDGFRIAQISDLHVGPHLSKSFLRRVASATGSLNADLVAVTGDLIDDRHEDVAEYERWFGSLRAPAGVYAVPGNHDIYAGWPQVEAALRKIGGLNVLVNESRLITRGADSIAIAGTGDPAALRRAPFNVDAGDAAPDIARTLHSVPPGVTTIALAHNPALWPELASRGVALTLSGHTHWGQFALPRLAWSAASPFLRHAMGTYHENNSMLYIHPGTGYWGLPFRLGAYAEVACIVLRRGEGGISVSG